MKKEIAIGMALVGIICIALFSLLYIQTPKTEYTPTSTPTPTPTLDIRDIVVTSENLNYDLWIHAQGGPATQTRYITLRNNGDVSAYLRVSCVGADFLEEVYYVGVGVLGDFEISLKPHTTQIVGITAYSATFHPRGAEGGAESSRVGEYSFVVATVELIDESYSIDGRYMRDYTTIAEFPVHIKVNDIRD